MLSMLGFVYADCIDNVNEADCLSAGCEWHTDEMACEDAGSDHDDHENCEDFLTESDCGMHSECEWHENHCEDVDTNDDGPECVQDCAGILDVNNEDIESVCNWFSSLGGVSNECFSDCSDEELEFPMMLGSLCSCNSLILAFGVGSYALLIGVSTAWLTAMCKFPGKNIFTWLLLLPMAMPLVHRSNQGQRSDMPLGTLPHP